MKLTMPRALTRLFAGQGVSAATRAVSAAVAAQARELGPQEHSDAAPHAATVAEEGRSPEVEGSAAAAHGREVEAATHDLATVVQSSPRSVGSRQPDQGWYRVYAGVLGVLFALAAVERVWGERFGELSAAIQVSRAGFGGLLAIASVVLLVVAFTGLQLLGSAVWTLIVLAYGGVAWLLLGGASKGIISDEACAVAFGLVSVGLLLIAAGIMFQRETVSSSLSLKTASGSTVLMLWTIVIVYAVAYVAASAFLSGKPVTCPSTNAQDCIRQSAWPDYLVLLGVPGAAAAYAKSKSLTEKSSEPATATTEVTNVQYFVFNILAMLFVAGGLWQFGRLDDVPDVLLGLSGASALTYALVKPEGQTVQVRAEGR